MMTANNLPAADISLGVLTVFSQEIPGKANAFPSLVMTEYNASCPPAVLHFVGQIQTSRVLSGSVFLNISKACIESSCVPRYTDL